MARKNARSLWTSKLLSGGRASGGGVGSGTGGGIAGGTGGTGGDAAGDAAAALFGVRRAYCGRVLGIDPSLRGTGLAVVEFAGGGASPVLRASRTLRINGRMALSECLGEIYKAVADLVEDWRPRHVALEQAIYVQNFRTALTLGSARGAAIAAAAVLGLTVFEYPPLRVKQAVVGFGRASKAQVSGMVSRLLGVAGALAFDEADAAGVAICHGFTWREGTPAH